MPTEPEEPRTEVLPEPEEPAPYHEPEEEGGGPVKTFLEHLEDLRWVLIKSLVAVGLGMLICLIAGDYVVSILKWPLSRAKIRYPGTNQVWTVSWGTNRLGVFRLNDGQQQRYAIGTNRYVELQVELVPTATNLMVSLRPALEGNPETAQQLPMTLKNYTPVGGFFVALQVAMYGGLLLAAPFLFYFVAAFVFPALKMNEKYYVYRGLGFGVTLFSLGVVFCYFILMPLALSASAVYSHWLGFEANEWRAEEYISFVCKFMLGMGIGFQMPVVLLTLVKIGVLSYSSLSKMRRYMIVINLVLGAVLTTPEVITQVLMAIPLQILYEISVWIAWWWERKERKRQRALGH